MRSNRRKEVDVPLVPRDCVGGYGTRWFHYSSFCRMPEYARSICACASTHTQHDASNAAGASELRL
jgi:hypothetical protein